jgi:glycosyltransferase involved in cell wall biosynthesis
MCSEVSAEFGVDTSKARIIGNPFHPPRSADNATRFQLWPRGSHPRILGVGRLSHEKGFDRLIASFPDLLRRHPESSLVILGEGNLRSLLESQIRDLGIEDRVQLPGFQPPGDWFRTCDLFVLPSRVEGFSNTLLEAVAAEVPVVSLEHPGGTSEIMQSIGISDRIVTCLSTWSESWFERPPHSVATRANELFGIDHVIEQYAGLLRDLSRVSVNAA